MSASQRMTTECEKMLKKKYTVFFGKLLREQVDTFIHKQILNPTHKITSDYLKDLALIDANGNVNTSNRFYNEFLKSFPDNGFEKDGSSIIDEFSRGKYGWDLDTIKIVTALALKNSDLKAANQGKVFSIPEDNSEMTSKNGPFAPRKRIGFDALKFTKINISDEEIRNAIRAIKALDPNMAVDLKLKDVAGKIQNLMGKVLNASIDSYSDVIPQNIKESLNITKSVAADINKRVDAEDVLVTFNKKLYSDDLELMATRFREILYISDHKHKITLVCKSYAMLKNEDVVSHTEIKVVAEKFILGELRLFEEVIKKYKVAFQQKYRGYENLYSEILADINNLPEWTKISEEQQHEVMTLIKFVKLDNLVFEELKVIGLGTLDDFSRIVTELSESKTKAVEKVHAFNDQNEMLKKQTSGNEQGTSSTPIINETPIVINRVSKKLRSYSNGRIINIDSIEKLSELDEVFSDIKRKIKKDLESGKKSRSNYRRKLMCQEQL